MAEGSAWWPHERWEQALKPQQRNVWRLAQELAASGRYAEAEQRLRELLETEPDFVPALSRLGAVLAAQDRRQEARHWLDEALARDPLYPPALSNKGNLLLALGEIEAAIALYRSALNVDEGYGTARHNLAVALKRSGDIEGFVREFKRARRQELARERDTARRRGAAGCLPVLLWMLIPALCAALILGARL